jgi:hypothetical protein
MTVEQLQAAFQQQIDRGATRLRYMLLEKTESGITNTAMMHDTELQTFDDLANQLQGATLSSNTFTHNWLVMPIFRKGS